MNDGMIRLQELMAITAEQRQLLWALACERSIARGLTVLRNRRCLTSADKEVAAQLSGLLSRSLVEQRGRDWYRVTSAGCLALLLAELESPSTCPAMLWPVVEYSAAPVVAVIGVLLGAGAVDALRLVEGEEAGWHLGLLCELPASWLLLPRFAPKVQQWLHVECWWRQAYLGLSSTQLLPLLPTIAATSKGGVMPYAADLSLLGLAPIATDDPFCQPITTDLVRALWPPQRLKKVQPDLRTLYDTALLAMFDLPQARKVLEALVPSKRWLNQRENYRPSWIGFMDAALVDASQLNEALSLMEEVFESPDGPYGPRWGELLLLLPMLFRLVIDDEKWRIKAWLREVWGNNPKWLRLLDLKPENPIQERVLAGVSQLLDRSCPRPYLHHQPTWQRWLEQLELAVTRDNREQQQDQRLVWMLADDWDSVTPRLQKKGVRGWQKGRVLSLWELQSQLSSLGVTDQQLTSLYRLQHDRFFQQNGLQLTFPVAHVLQQARNLVDHNGDALVVVQEHPLLVVMRSKDQIQLDLLPHMADDVLVPRQSGVFAFVDPGDEGRRLLELVESMPGGFPVDQHLALETQLARMAGVSWYSELSGQGNINLQPWDERPHLWLEWRDHLLTISICHQPLDDALTRLAHQSGSGVAWVAQPGAKGSWFRRDLKKELATSLALSKQLGLPTERDRQWRLIGEEVITFIDQLSAMPDLPVHWRGAAARVMSNERLNLQVTSQQDWFAVSGQLEVDQQQVVELRTLLSHARTGYLQLSSGSLLLLSQQLRRQLQLLDSVLDADQRVDQRLAYPLAQLIESQSHSGDQGWQALSQRWQEKPVLAPELLEPLRDYQRTAVKWAAHLAMHQFGACLADDMGLGKTLQALTLIRHFGVDGASLVVAPKSVVGNWLAEAARFAPELQLIDLEAVADREQVIATAGPRQVVVISYGLLPRLETALHQRQWQVAVLDEAQQIKNASTKRANTAFQLNAQCRFALSGTPIENHLGELWSLFAFINPGLLGNKTQFNRRYGNAATNAEELWRLRALVGPFIMRRTKQQVLAELPAKTEITHHVELSAAERTAYEAVRKEALAQAKVQGQGLVAILAGLTRLRQVCCDQRLVFPQHKQRGSKLEEALLLVQEALENGRRVLVFSQFVSLLKLFTQPLEAAAIDYCYLDGQCTTGQRRKAIERFKTDGVPLFLISLKAGGTGLNLTEADTVIHLDPWWNPAVEDQASDRAHRMGQTQPVTVYRLVARNTVEDKIVQMHRDKRELADKILDGQNDAKGLSPDLLLSLMSE